MIADGNAVDRIAELAREGQEIDQLVTTVDGKVMSSVALYHIPPKPEPEPRTLELSRLQSLVDYLAENRDGLDLEKCVIHVAGPTTVRFLGNLTGESRQRFVYAQAQCSDLMRGFLGQALDQEPLVIGLQSRFVATDESASLLRLVGLIKEEGAVESTDDGRSQKVATRAGILLQSEADVPNPVKLRPYRTFREVEQPDASFILRVQKGPRLTLHEADGGAWEIQAVERVAEWLRNALSLEDAADEGGAQKVIPVPVMA